MKAFNTIFGIMAALCLISASCAKEEQDIPADGRMSFSSTLLSTRTTDTDLQATQLETGVKAGVFVQRETSYITNGNNAVLTADGAGGFTAEKQMFWPSEAAVNIYAYAPYDEEWAGAPDSEMDFTVSTDQSSDAGYLASDLLIGAPESNPLTKTETPVELRFAHMLSKVNVEFVNDNPDVSLQGAVINLVGLNTSVKVNVAEAALGETSSKADVKIAAFADDAEQFAASGIVVPQTVPAGPFVQIVLADSRVFEAGLSSDVVFKSNKRYVYTVYLGGDGDQVKVGITLGGSSIGDWEDDDSEGLEGSGNEVIEYVVGDYVLADGTLMKKADFEAAADEVKATAAGVIFSTNVSAADAAAGYDGYAMSVWGRKGSQTWSSQSMDAPLADAVENLAAACLDLDGLTFASLVKEIDGDYSYFTAFNFANYSSQRIALTGSNLSGWYVPSMGQLVQIIENLGGSEVAETRTDFDNGQSEIFGGETTLTDNLNAFLINSADTDVLASGNFIASATESSATHMWGVTLGATNTAGTSCGYKISAKASKGNGGRNVIPVFAYKK